MQVRSPAQLRTFLTHVRGDRLYAAWMLFATTGMRRGEVAGLRWVDVDLAAGRVTPRKPRVEVNYKVHVSEPKTAKGKRSLALDRWFERLAREAGLPKIRLYDVRHSYATAALAAGVPAKVVSERLGHANIAITMDTSSHVLPGMDQRAASVVARLTLDDEPPGEAAR
jgi:integrase